MRILVSRISINQTIGGAELSARDICRSLIKLGHKPFYITNLRSTMAVKNMPKKYLFYIPLIHTDFSILNKIVRPLNLIFLFFYYLYIVIKIRPDILNPQSRDDQLVATLVGKVFNIPTIWRDPGDLRPQLSHKVSNSLQKINRFIQKISILNASAIFTLNEEDKNYIIRNTPKLDPQKMFVIKSNIMFEDYQPRNKENNSKNITIGCISRLDEHKGVQYVIEVFHKLQKKRNNRLSLLIAGDGEYKKELESLARNIKGIKFLGHINDVSKVFNDIDIFVQPAEFEGWGRNIKEAKYFEKTVVASNVGGIKKQIVHNQTGLLFDIGNVDLLYRQLESLIDKSEKRIKLAKNARKSALEEGDWTKTVRDEIIPLFEQYIKKPIKKGTLNK